MRIFRLSVLAIALAFALAPAASAMQQDLRSPDAADADAAAHAQTLQDLARLHADKADDAALAQEQYYSSYGPASHPAATAADSSPWLTVALGVGLTLLVAGGVAVAVRTRRRTARVRVAA
jgi:hypothetical protein